MSASKTTGHRCDQGFSLIEMLVALSLLALITAFMPAAIKASSRAISSAALLRQNLTGMVTDLRFVEQRLAEAMPIYQSRSGNRALIAFTGTRDSVSFVAPVASGPHGGGLYRITLSVEPRGIRAEPALVLRTLPFPTGIEAPILEERTLRSALSGAAFRYLSTAAGAGDAIWQPTWTGQDRLPALVELSLTEPGASVPRLYRFATRLAHGRP